MSNIKENVNIREKVISKYIGEIKLVFFMNKKGNYRQRANIVILSS